MRMLTKSTIALTIASSLANLAVADDSAIEKIMVKGQKIDRTLQETPASVAVITSQTIERENLNDFYDVLARTPNASGTDGSGFNIRGIDAFGVTDGGTGGLASVYVDGAPVPYRIMQQGAFSTWDISQVEILRGPQSTLQGRNSLAGAVVMKTRDAVQEYNFKGRVGMGEYGTKEAAVAFGGGLIEDELAFRVSAEQRDFDGYNTNVASGEESDFDNNEFYRAKLRYTPSALPEFEAQLSFMHSENEKGVDWVMEQSGHENYPINNIYDDRFVYLDSPTFESTEADLYILNLDYDISDEWSFSSISTYSDAVYGYEWDGDASMQEPKSILTDTRTDKTTTQEVRFTYEGEKLSGLIGVYYSDLDVFDSSGGERGITFEQLGVRSLLTAPAQYGGLGLSGALADQVLQFYTGADPVYIGQSSDFTQKVKTKALFADFTYEINDAWDIFAGLRYDKEEQANGTNADIYITEQTQNALPQPESFAADPMLAQLIAGINMQLYAMADGASGDEPVEDAKFDAWLPKVGTTYRFNQDVSTSFTIQKGYRSGGVGTNIAQATPFTFDPEYTWNYELAFRSVWLDQKLVINANMFYLDWTDQQVSVYLSGNQYDRETRNVGESHVQGFETEISYELTPSTNLYGGIGYSKTKFDEFSASFNGEEQDYSGYSFEGAPEWTALIGLDYANADGFIANINASYTGSSQRLATALEPRNDAYWLVNSRVGYQWSNYGVYALIDNLLDEEYIALAPAGFGNQTLSSPRTASVRFEVNF
ncbi:MULTISPECIES: TonB-dependent receptor [unclassified Pseudoalteromonas]|uniref:TonB-dependent receptor n=1 Tax=unclassified Pseudoalteromonas TaxID=194690 RepID=UPI0025B4BCC9|nr:MULTISPECIES: TonB-dependent receptor [unclassified Pseudoalteromonas]MDN3388097.1 TonB-dependent receptor [Pseudoalteromonas sp. APC 4017]